MSKISNFLVSSDQMVRDAENNRIDLSGNVQIIFQDNYLYSQKATIDMVTKQIVASGRVSVLTPQMSIDGDRIELNYETSLGTIFNGFVQSGNVTFEGEIVRKVGDNEFEVERGVYTACKTCPPSWSFSGKRIRAELGGYAYITSPIFRIASYPFFWLPYLIVPLKSDRQSGILFPTFDYTRVGGSELAESFFWAIDPHRDLTFTLKRYSKRGIKGLVNYRFFADQDSYGEFNGAYLYDKVFPTSDRIVGLSEKESIERWFMRYHQLYNLPGDFVQRTQVNLVSDLQYLSDFQSSGLQREAEEALGDPALENRLSLTNNTEDLHASAEAAYYINLLKTNAKTNNDDAVNRLPEINLSIAEHPIGRSKFLGKVDLNYVNFARNNFAFDDITYDPNISVTKRFNSNRDGEFNFDGTNSRDQLRSGQRLDVAPQVSYPFQLGANLDILPLVTYRYTGYNFGIGDDPSVSRSYLKTELSARSRFFNIYGSDSDFESRYKHEIIPEVTLSNVPYFNQPDHPFFGTSSDLANFRSNQPISDTDFYGDSGLQFDYYDRILDRKIMRLGITNTITEKNWIAGVANYQQIGLLRVSQSYDFIEARKSTEERPWSDIEVVLDLRLRHIESNTTVTYFPYHQVSNILSRVKLKTDVGNYLQFSLTRRYTIGDSLEVDKDNRVENLAVSAGWISKYFNFVGQTDYSIVTQKMISWFYQIELKPPGECWGLVFNHLQPTGGDAKFGFNFSYSFDGKSRASLTNSMY